MTIGSLINDISTLTGIGGQSYLDQLQKASWRGVPFFVTASHGRFGRRNAVHDYPFRDATWVEDLGRARQVLRVTGYLVGDDVIAQSNKMIAACEAKSESDEGGELVHPIYGKVKLALLDFSITQTVAGRIAELEFAFVSSGKRLFPQAVTSTQGDTAAAATTADAAATASLGSRISAALKQGAAVVQSVLSTVQQYGGLVFRLVNDATSLVKTVQSLPGQFGRFFAGASSTVFGLTSAAGLTNNGSATVPQLIATGAANRATVAAAMKQAQASASTLSAGTVSAFGAQTQAVMTALAGSTQDPADQVRLFSSLVALVPSALQGSTFVVTAQSATADLWRRAALTALARASARYQPSSYDDAAALRVLIGGLIDAEIAIAGNQGEDAVFTALLALKTAVANDLTTRGATLAPIVPVSFGASLPAPFLAQRLYQDASRAGELMGEANVRNPAFMPVSFRALAS